MHGQWANGLKPIDLIVCVHADKETTILLVFQQEALATRSARHAAACLEPNAWPGSAQANITPASKGFVAYAQIARCGNHATKHTTAARAAIESILIVFL